MKHVSIFYRCTFNKFCILMRKADNRLRILHLDTKGKWEEWRTTQIEKVTEDGDELTFKTGNSYYGFTKKTKIGNRISIITTGTTGRGLIYSVIKTLRK